EVFRMGDARADICPAIRLVLYLDKLLPLVFTQDASRRCLESLKVKQGLLPYAGIQESADLEILVDRFFDLFGRHTVSDRLDHHRVEFCVLSFFEPVMLEQALELRVE